MLRRIESSAMTKSKPRRIQLFSWNGETAAQRSRELRAAGFDVAPQTSWNPALERDVRAKPPDAFVIDLSRTPSMGRDIGVALRSYRSVAHVPLVFVDGAAPKLDRLKTFIPDAVYTASPQLSKAVSDAIA